MVVFIKHSLALIQNIQTKNLVVEIVLKRDKYFISVYLFIELANNVNWTVPPVHPCVHVPGTGWVLGYNPTNLHRYIQIQHLNMV